MLACAVLASAVVAAPPVAVPLGAEEIPLELGLEIRTLEHGAAAPALAWASRLDGALEAWARGPGFEATVELSPAPGAARTVTVAVRWTRAVAVERAALTVAWSGVPRAILRDLSFAPVGAPRRIGRGTPLLVAAGGAVLAGGPGLAGAWIDPVRGGVRTTLLLDDRDERPFSTYRTCLERMPPEVEGQHVRWRDLEERSEVRVAPRAPGEVDRARATLYPLGDSGPFLPVILERWPAGARAAVVLTDHADRTDPDALRAVLWGSSDPAAEGRPGAGLLGHGLALTRTFFVRSRLGALDDPEVRRLADELAEAGSEVALHSVTPARDDREAVRAGLESARAWHPVTWIDHQPYTNCEALSSLGAGSGGPYAVRDLLVDAGVRWAWAANDVDGAAGPRVVNLLGGDPARARPAIFPLPGDPRIWVFRSSMFFAPPAELGRALSDEALEGLERERGIFVAHTYLGASARTTRLPSLRARLAVVEQGGGLAVDPALEAAFARLEARVRAGTLASLPWREAGDRLRALGDVEVAYLPDGAVEVRNHGAGAIPALTVALPASELEISVRGAVLLGREDDDGWARIWFDLPAGETATLRAYHDLVPVPALPFR